MIQTLPFTLASLKAAYAEGVSPQEVVEEVYRRIDAVDDDGIFILLFDKQEVLDAANGLGGYDPDRPLWGIPFVIKDNIDAAGKMTTAGCPAYGYEASDDAFVVRRLLDAGALLIGKTNLDQFATGLVGTRSPYPIPKNAVDPDIIPGGSSSGSAVAVGHGIVSFSLGTDTAGSGRVPAGLNNIVGLKPTLGTFSATGVVPACRTLDTVSVFALTVDDAYRVFQCASAYDPNDAYSREFGVQPLGATKPSFKVGVPWKASAQFFGDDIQSASFQTSLDAVAKAGGEIIELDFQPLYDIATMLYFGPWVAERYTVIEDLLKTDPTAIHPVTTAIITKAADMSAADAYRGFYAFADLKRQAMEMIGSVDLLCVPTMPTFYTVADLNDDPFIPNNNNGTYTNFVNLLDLCAISVPMAARQDGRPGSITLVAKAGDDAAIASLGRRLQADAGVSLGATGWAMPALAKPGRETSSDEIAIVVAGAHMSGLPLNGDLQKLGARFIKSTTTAPNYKLYALAGGPPYRPGLVRSDEGRHIDVEVWALPKKALGSFVETIPAPLGIGSVTLSDGSVSHGFICEPIGLTGAEDITAHGGWRQFITSSQTQTAAQNAATN